jgi:hypothetical protein
MKRLLSVLAVAGLAFVLPSCDEAERERAKDKIERGVDKAGDKIEDAGDWIEKKTDRDGEID